MHVLLATPLYSQHYDSGHFWLRALNQLGHTVTLWDYRLDASPPPTTRYPDVTIVLKGENVNPKKLPGSPRYLYWPDALERSPGIEEVLKLYDKAFGLVKPLPDWIEWIPSGWDPAIHRGLDVYRGTNSIYIGTNNSSYKMKMITDIKPDLVNGNGWELKAGPPQYLHDFVYLANRARILIDVHQSPTAGPNRKFFECIACGFTIVDRVPGIQEILGWGLTNQVTFKTPEEARELIKYYLERPKERGEIWQLEREKIQGYTYEKVVRKVLSHLG